MPTRTIVVTDKHIREGWHGDSEACPVARAMQEAGLSYPAANASELCFDDACTPTPKQVREFIMEFDARLPVEPFTFELEWED